VLRDGAAIRCRGVFKAYPSDAGLVPVLEDVSFDAPPAGITAVLGPSGAGKSTLLRLLAGMDVADRGSVAVLGRELVAQTARGLRSLRRDTVTFLDQRGAANLVPHLTLAQQVGGATEAAVALGLGDRLDAVVSELSGGEQARGGLAAGLARRTPLLLLDEPTAELDGGAAAALVELLQAEAQHGRAVVVATHDARLARAASATVDLSPHVAAPAASGAARVGPPGDVVLAVRDLTKRYAGRAVVEEASLELRAGEIGVLLGRSGSGKSTLLMAIGGWLAPDAGTVVVAGAASRAPRWHELSYLAQRFALLPELTVADNVSLPERLGAGSAGAANDALVESLGLAGLAQRLPARISVGQQQRVALARALTPVPRVLVADEPTSHQDARSARLVWSALRAATTAGAACLVATNDESAAGYGDRVWTIAEGCVSPFEPRGGRMRSAP